MFAKIGREKVKFSSENAEEKAKITTQSRASRVQSAMLLLLCRKIYLSLQKSDLNYYLFCSAWQRKGFMPQ